MSRPFLITSVALLVSLGLNAWQLSQRAGTTGPQDRKPTLADSKGSIRRGTGSAKADQSGPPADHGETSTGEHPPGSLAEILAMRDPMARIDALLAFVKNVPVDQIGGILKELQMGADKWDPGTRLLAHLLLTRWAQEDPDAAFASLENRGKEGGGDAMSILASLTATDPARAVAWLGDPENPMTQQPFLAHLLARSIGDQWALHDPDAALQWAAGLPDGQRAGAYSGIIGKLAGSDPQRAAALAMELDPSERGRLLREIGERWALQSPDQAVAWASSLEGNDRAGALSEALAGWARSAPRDAAAYLDELPEAERADHVGSLGRTWAQQAPAEAAAWLGTQAESVGRADAMGHALWNWTNADPEAAAAWVGQLPAGPSYDSGVAGLAKASAQTFNDPETGVAWAATIENEQLRSTMTQHALERWTRQDPEAARAWAVENGVEAPAPGSGK
jgi:hypothetical protein